MRKKMFIFLCAGIIIFTIGCSNRHDNGRRNEFNTMIENSAENTEEEVFEEEEEVFETDDSDPFESGKDSEAEKTGKDIKVSEGDRLTLTQVLELSEKDKLDWLDFDGYICEDVGSGLLISKYDIDDDFYLLVGGTGQGEPMYVRLVSAQNMNDYLDLKREEGIDSALKSEINVHQANGREDVERFIQEKRSVPYYLEIAANVKEVGEDSLLIRSHNDAFPGVFSIINVHEAMGDREMDDLNEEFQELTLKGGMHIRVLMERANQTMQENDTIPVYKAKEIILLPDDKVSASEDILLTSAPALSLIDTLSSQYAHFSVQSGNYTWAIEENGEEKQIIACGSAPLDEASMEKMEKLIIPHYPTDEVLYSYSTKISPDILTVRQWDIADLGNPEAKEEKVIVYYDGMNCLNLQRDKIYEFTAEWAKAKVQKNKFYGTASYIVVTE